MKDEPMTAQQAYMIVAATLASANKQGKEMKDVWNEYVKVLSRVRRETINPTTVGKGEKFE